MIQEFEPTVKGITSLIALWEPKLLGLHNDVISRQRNSQNRTIKQIVGHMVDSASNNTHRVVHMQYQPSPITFPNYASNGNNDRWIAIQNYQDEDWTNLINLWKYSNLHFAHVVENVPSSMLNNQWCCNEVELVSLKQMVIDYLRHLELHLGEIDEMIHA